MDPVAHFKVNVNFYTLNVMLSKLMERFDGSKDILVVFRALFSVGNTF